MAKKGHIVTPEHREKIRQALLGRKLPESVKRKVSDTCKANGVGKWMLGKKQSIETSLKKSLATKGKKRTPEAIAAIRAKIPKGSSHYLWKGGITRGDNFPIYNRHNAKLRRARVKGAEGRFTSDEWERLKAECDYRCLSCLKSEPEITLTVDHIIPLKLSGSNFISNIQPLCGRCNRTKHLKSTNYLIK